MTRDEKIDYAEQNGWDYIETTSEGSGYPKNLEVGIIGFDTWDELVKAKEQTGLTTAMFFKRDGWNLYYRHVRNITEPIDMCDELEVYYSNKKEFIDNEFAGCVTEDSVYEQNVSSIEIQNALDLFNHLKDNEMVGKECYSDYEWKIFPKTTMKYSYDSKTYVIGLI